MRNISNKVAIIGGARIPFTKSFGYYSQVTNSELLTGALQALINKYGLEGERLDEVVLGTLIHYPTAWNWAREIVQNTTLHPHTPVLFHARACGTSLDASNTVAMKIATGQIESGIAGGSDTNSDVPLTLDRSFTRKLIKLQQAKSLGSRLSALFTVNPLLLLKFHAPDVREPRTGKNMGEHTELTVKNWGISREEQDLLAYQSHLLAEKAFQDGFFENLVFPFNSLSKDSLIRPDTTLDKLASLKPAFDKSPNGSLTAGNSSAFTDGAASVLLTSEEYAKKHNLEPEAFYVDSQNAALDYVHGEDLLLAPTVAVARLLERNNLTLQDFDFYEIHEAFAGQVLATLKAWESDKFAEEYVGRDKALGSIDRKKLNTRGGSIAIGHPFAATGARVLGNAAKILKENGGGRCLVSVCTAGGMGTAAIIEA
jgi:acetyl-CoA C-acetyltransferase